MSPLASGGPGVAVLLVLLLLSCSCLLFSTGLKFPGDFSVITTKSSRLLEARLEYFQLTSLLLGASRKMPARRLLRQSEYLLVA